MRASVVLKEGEPAYDQAALIAELKVLFPAIAVLRYDSPLPTGPLETSFKPLSSYGPRWDFEIAQGSAPIRGYVLPRDISFKFSASPERETWDTILEFCRRQRGTFKFLLVATLHLDEEEPPYDQVAVANDLQETFPHVQISSGDQLAMRAERLEKTKLSVDPKTKQMMVDALWRNARQYGPAYAVEIPAKGGPITGNFRQRDMTFITHALPDDVWERVVEFCQRQRGRLEIVR